MKKWKVQFSVALVLLCGMLISAKVHHRQDEREAMHKEMREYATQNILPVMKAQRLKLDKKLSAKDKATIEEVRAKLKAGHEAKREEMKKLREQLKNGEMDREKMKAHFKGMREERKALVAPVEAIAKKHESKIEKVLAVAKANQETWKQDMEAIRKKYISDEELEEMKARHRNKRRALGKKEGEHKGEHGQGKHFRMKHRGHANGKMKGAHHMRMFHHAFKPVGFLLWDPNAPIPAFDDTDGIDELGVYPNPSTAANKISFAVQQKGLVKIELLDKSGTLVKTVLSEVKDSGNYTVDVDLTTLPNAVYYYRITTAAGSKTTRFLIDK
ncbi:MAG: T9SS type A sorting domain-containing protein [Flammeovirgaceae bacterium]